jgi:hypothetical protein
MRRNRQSKLSFVWRSAGPLVECLLQGIRHRGESTATSPCWTGPLRVLTCLRLNRCGDWLTIDEKLTFGWHFQDADALSSVIIREWNVVSDDLVRNLWSSFRASCTVSLSRPRSGS